MKITARVTESSHQIRAIYTFLFCPYTYTLFCGKIIAVFLSKLDHRLLFNYIDYETILVRELVSR